MQNVTLRVLACLWLNGILLLYLQEERIFREILAIDKVEVIHIMRVLSTNGIFTQAGRDCVAALTCLNHVLIIILNFLFNLLNRNYWHRLHYKDLRVFISGRFFLFLYWLDLFHGKSIGWLNDVTTARKELPIARNNFDSVSIWAAGF